MLNAPWTRNAPIGTTIEQPYVTLRNILSPSCSTDEQKTLKALKQEKTPGKTQYRSATMPKIVMLDRMTHMLPLLLDLGQECLTKAHQAYLDTDGNFATVEVLNYRLSDKWTFMIAETSNDETLLSMK